MKQQPKKCKVVDCPLTHCPCGTHDEEHECVFEEVDEEVAAAERAAGWDSNP